MDQIPSRLRIISRSEDKGPMGVGRLVHDSRQNLEVSQMNDGGGTILVHCTDHTVYVLCIVIRARILIIMASQSSWRMLRPVSMVRWGGWWGGWSRRTSSSLTLGISTVR